MRCDMNKVLVNIARRNQTPLDRAGRRPRHAATPSHQ